MVSSLLPAILLLGCCKRLKDIFEREKKGKAVREMSLCNTKNPNRTLEMSI